MEIIDLTHNIENGMPCFGAAWHCKTDLEKMGLIDEVGRNTTKLVFGSHCGTHIDSPRHFIPNGNTIDKIPLERLIGKVQILDFSYLKKDEPVTKNMLVDIDLKEKIIFYFNWAEKFSSPAEFYNNYPYFEKDAATYLIEKNVKLIGLDTPSPDDSRIKLLSSEDSKIHKLFLSNEIVLIEYLNIPKLKDYTNWNIIAFPLKLKNCDGSPARVCIYKN